MTGTRKPQQDGSIQAVLRDAGLESAAELRGALENLQALVPDQAPAPRADLAALLAAGGPATAASEESADSVEEPPLPAGVASLAAHRRSRGNRRRMALVGGAVVGAMSLRRGCGGCRQPGLPRQRRPHRGQHFPARRQRPGPRSVHGPTRRTIADLPAAPARSPRRHGPVAAPTVQASAPAVGPAYRSGASTRRCRHPPAVGRARSCRPGPASCAPTPPERPAACPTPTVASRLPTAGSHPAVSPLPTVPGHPRGSGTATVQR